MSRFSLRPPLPVPNRSRASPLVEGVARRRRSTLSRWRWLAATGRRRNGAGNGIGFDDLSTARQTQEFV
jgi:hypothetical protein